MWNKSITLDDLEGTSQLGLYNEKGASHFTFNMLSAADWYMEITRIAAERSLRLRAKYNYKIGARYKSNQLVFVDESAADRRTTYRGYAWAIKGRRAVRKAFFVRGRR